MSGLTVTTYKLYKPRDAVENWLSLDDFQATFPQIQNLMRPGTPIAQVDGVYVVEGCFMPDSVIDLRPYFDSIYQKNDDPYIRNYAIMIVPNSSSNLKGCKFIFPKEKGPSILLKNHS